jgi:hypothetical protein
MTEEEVKYWPTTPHWKRPLVSTECTSIAASSSVIAAEIQRPGRGGAASARRAGPYRNRPWWGTP